jgi:hypothetical protein
LFQAINYVMTSATIYAGRELECPLEIEKKTSLLVSSEATLPV